MKVKAPLVTNVNTFEDLRRFCAVTFDQVLSILNGGITVTDNMNLKVLTFAFTATDKDVGVAHGLGSIPLGYFIVGAADSASAAANLYDGVTKNSTTTLYLRSTAVGTVRVAVFV